MYNSTHALLCKLQQTQIASRDITYAFFFILNLTSIFSCIIYYYYLFIAIQNKQPHMFETIRVGEIGI